MKNYRSVVFGLLAISGIFAGAEENVAMETVPEAVYEGELLRYPGPWAFNIGKSSIIYVSDEELETLARDPDQVINMTLTFDKHEQSLRQVCERAQAAGQRTLILAFDHFFAQYRPGQAGKPRRLTPDTEECIALIAAISKFAQQYGLGLELSLLSPLEIGPGYVAQTGESGVWMHYRKGVRDPESGAYSVQLWRQRRWANNKGPLLVENAGVRVFAFRDRGVGGTPYRVVDPKDIVEITDSAEVEVMEGLKRRAGDYEAVRIRVHGTARDAGGGRDRVLVVQMYRTPEMDYFSEQALPYLQKLCDRYADAGVKINALYADEMHIQQNWGYFSHHDNGAFALRYVSPGFARRFAARHGAEYEDFAKYMVYFVYGQEDTANDLSAKDGIMHVFGDSPEAIRATALFRSRYYALLQDGVVDLFTEAKRHMERRMGHKLEARAHATWAESPTIDKWNVGQDHHPKHQYEYTSNFVWSCTVHQAASACHDYFKWGDFLTGNGNDHAEGGWLDRNYLGLALACSTGIINEVPYSYGAHWGMPAEISHRRMALVNAFGAAAWQPYAMVQNMEHRDTEVMMLYPLDLVAAEERFGSWMSQYAYANLITQTKLLEHGTVLDDGAIDVAGRRFTTLVALFEPFPDKALLDMMRLLAEGGGRVVWSGPPPVLFADGSPALDAWQELMGVAYAPMRGEGVIAPGRQVVFSDALDGIVPMPILTDFIVDRIYPVIPQDGVETVARAHVHTIGTHRKAGKGTATFLGFRPRDDQSGSLGYEARWWFEILDALGAYPPTGAFPGVNDNPDYLSRTTEYMVCRFPNGAVAVAPHLRDLEECWPGGFARKAEEDAALVATLDLPTDRITLRDFKAAGHALTFEGHHALAFRADKDGQLLAFAGRGAQSIEVNGRRTVYADSPMDLVAWAPVEGERRKECGALLEMFFLGEGEVRIPIGSLPQDLEVVMQGAKHGSRGEVIPSRIEEGALIFDVRPGMGHRWIFAIPKTT